QAGFFRFVAELASKVMKAEERDLTRVWESVNIAAGAIREKNAEQIREILGEAREALHDIGDRRRKMGATIQQAQQQVRSQEPPGERQERAERQQRERMEAMMARIGAILTEVRELPEDQFRANRRAIVQQLLAALRAPAEPGPAEEMTPEQRVRAKMRLAGEMYLQLKRETDADTSELDARFDEARQLITEHRYEEAEKLVDAGVGRMRAMMAEAGGSQLGDDTLAPTPLEQQPQLDLRGIGADEPIVPPPPPVGEETRLNLDTDLETEVLTEESDQ
ncbi:MAG: hypothetical protein ACP5KN_04160, partial [Armatimonadota bacterium]